MTRAGAGGRGPGRQSAAAAHDGDAAAVAAGTDPVFNAFDIIFTSVRRCYLSLSLSLAAVMLSVL